MAEIKKLGEKLVYKAKVVELYEDYLELPDGKQVTYDLIKFKGGAGVLPITNDGQIILIKQYRNTLGHENYEIPAGCYNYKGEPPQLCAARELEEEIGFQAGKLEYFTEIITAIGVGDEKTTIFFATDLKLGTQKLDPEEYIEISYFTMEQALEMIYSGEIMDAKTVTAILGYHVKYNLPK